MTITAAAGQQAAQPVNFVDAAGNPLGFAPNPSLTATMSVSAAGDNGTLIKSSAAYIFKLRGYNAKSSALCLRIYNKSTAPGSAGDTPLMRIYIKPTEVFDINFDVGFLMTAGLGFAFTTDFTAVSTSGILANDVLAFQVYYA